MASRVHGNRARTVLRETVGKGPYSVVKAQQIGHLAGGLPYQYALMDRMLKPKHCVFRGTVSCGGVHIQATCLQTGVIDVEIPFESILFSFSTVAALAEQITKP